LVFKRYIYKRGKKLGPYYYENVRTNNGRVKTVYVGTNPRHHTKHKIKRPLFFVILISVLFLILGGSLFFLENKAYLIKKVTTQESDFDVDQILLKVLIKSGDFIEKQIRVMSAGNEPANISINLIGLSDIIKIGSPYFTIKPGQIKSVSLNFTSYLPQQNIEQQPGVYIGKLLVKSEKASKEIPTIVEINSKNVLFAMNLNPVAIERRVLQGSDMTIEVRLYNLESIESSNVDVEYFVKDINGNTITTESETVVVKTQASFFKTISIPKKLKVGSYVFAGDVKFGNSISTASYLFEVVGPQNEDSFVKFCQNSILCLGLSLTTIILLFALMAYFYFFIGAYLYDKITGNAIIPRKKSRTEVKTTEKPAIGIFEKLKNQLKKWNEGRKHKKLKESAEKKKEVQVKLIDEEAIKKQEELEKEKQIEEQKRLEQERRLRLDEEKRKQKEIERQKIEEEKRLQLEARRKQIEQEKRQREEQKRLEQEQEEEKQSLLKEKLRKERKERVKKFFHRIGLYKTPEEKKQILLEKEKIRQEEIKREEELRKQKELEKQKQLEEKKRLDEELKRKKELEEKQKEQERIEINEEKRLKLEQDRIKQKELERLRIEKEKRIREEFLRKQEELKKQQEFERKKQIMLEKEKIRQEEIKREEELRKQKELEKQKQLKEKKRLDEELKRKKELEEKQKEQERIEAEKRQIEEQKRLDEDKKRREEFLRKQEELKKQQELERKKQIELQKILEEERKKREQERIKQEQLKAEKVKIIGEVELNLSKNEENYKKIESQLRKTEEAKNIFSNRIKEIGTKIKNNEDEIINKSKLNKELDLQKQALSKKYEKQIEDLKKQQEIEAAANQLKIRDLKTKLESKKAALLKNLEEELQKLSPEKRNKVEKWKRLEIKAKIKLEDHSFEEELDSYISKATDGSTQIEEVYKEGLDAINKKQYAIKKEISYLKTDQKNLLVEKDSISNEFILNQNKMHGIKQKLEKLENEKENLRIKLSQLKSDISKFKSGFFRGLFSKSREEPQKILQEQAAQIPEPEEELRKQKELEKQKEVEEKRKEQERIEINEEKRLKLEQDRIKQKELERLRIEKENIQIKEDIKLKEIKVKTQEEMQKKKSFFEKLFGRSEEEEMFQTREPKSDIQTIEEEIKKLGLFKQIEKKVVKEKKKNIFSRLFKWKQQMPELNTKARAKSREFEKFYRVLNKSKHAMELNDIKKAKKLYLKARDIYIGMQNEDKREVYNELTELYNHLKG